MIARAILGIAAALGIVTVAPVASAQASQCVIEIKHPIYPETTRAGLEVRDGKIVQGIFEHERSETTRDASGVRSSIRKLFLLLSPNPSDANWLNPLGIGMKIGGMSIELPKPYQSVANLTPAWLEVTIRRHWSDEKPPSFRIPIVARPGEAIRYEMSFFSDLQKFVPGAKLVGSEGDAVFEAITTAMLRNAEPNARYNIDFGVLDRDGRYITGTDIRFGNFRDEVILPAMNKLRADYSAGKCLAG